MCSEFNRRKKEKSNSKPGTRRKLNMMANPERDLMFFFAALNRSYKYCFLVPFHSFIGEHMQRSSLILVI